MKKILVVVDVQNDFITGTLGSKEAKKKVPNIVSKIENFEGDYIFATRDTHDENYLNTKEGASLPIVHCIEGTEGWEIETSVADAITKRVLDPTPVVAAIINKPTFGSYELVDAVKAFVKDDDCEIELCGFCTGICVISNALLLKAALYDKATIKVDGNYCACISKPTHRAALETMKCCQIDAVED